jgi:hypothetical protein
MLNTKLQQQRYTCKHKNDFTISGMEQDNIKSAIISEEHIDQNITGYPDRQWPHRNMNNETHATLL